MFATREVVAVPEGGRDKGLDAEAQLELGPWQIVIPYVRFPSRPLASLQLASWLPQSVGADGRSFCNLRIELSEQWRV